MTEVSSIRESDSLLKTHSTLFLRVHEITPFDGVTNLDVVIIAKRAAS